MVDEEEEKEELEEVKEEEDDEKEDEDEEEGVQSVEIVVWDSCVDLSVDIELINVDVGDLFGVYER